MSILQKNVEALERVAPDVAALVKEWVIPPGFERVTGTDGTPTFLRTSVGPEGKKRLEWLGGTSMPAASAEGLVSSLDPTGGAGGGGAQNGLGLSIGTGYEWAAFAARLGAAQAVYVYEPSAALRMALEVCDLSPLLATKKLVLLAGPADRAGAQLVQWLTDHPGMEPPTVLHPLPTAGGGNADERNALLAAGETIVRQAVMHRQAQVGALTTRLVEAAARQRQGPMAEAAVLALTLSPRYAQERPLHALSRHNGWEHLTIDRPETASVALRAERLVTLLERGPVRVVSDLFRGALGCVPPEVPVETWVPPLAGAGYWSRLPAPAEMAAVDRVVVHAEEHLRRLTGHGVPAGQIALRPVPACGEPRGARMAEGLALRHRAAIIADLPRISPESLEIVLPTHEAIYAAARELIAQDFLSVHTGSAPDLLRRAFARAGVTGAQAEDPALREPMLMLICDALLPAVPMLVLAEALRAQGVALSLIGDWPEWDRGAAGKNGQTRVIPFSAGAEERWAEVAVLVHLSPTGVVSPLVWEAVGEGVAVVAPEHPADRLGGSVATLLTPEVEYLRPRATQLLATVKRVLGDSGLRQKIAGAASERATGQMKKF